MHPAPPFSGISLPGVDSGLSWRGSCWSRCRSRAATSVAPGLPDRRPSLDRSRLRRKTKQSLADKGKKTLVLCYAPTELKWDNEAVDQELAKHVAYRLNMNKIKVIDPDRVT